LASLKNLKKLHRKFDLTWIPAEVYPSCNAMSKRSACLAADARHERTNIFYGAGMTTFKGLNFEALEKSESFKKVA
jgi:hypothetical protein